MLLLSVAYRASWLYHSALHVSLYHSVVMDLHWTLSVDSTFDTTQSFWIIWCFALSCRVVLKIFGIYDYDYACLVLLLRMTGTWNLMLLFILLVQIYLGTNFPICAIISFPVCSDLPNLCYYSFPSSLYCCITITIKFYWSKINNINTVKPLQRIRYFSSAGTKENPKGTEFLLLGPPMYIMLGGG